MNKIQFSGGFVFITALVIAISIFAPPNRAPRRAIASEKAHRIKDLFKTPFELNVGSTEGSDENQTPVGSGAYPDLQECSVSICGEVGSNLTSDDLIQRQAERFTYSEDSKEYQELDALLKELIDLAQDDPSYGLKETDFYADQAEALPTKNHQIFINGMRLFSDYMKMLIYQYEQGVVQRGSDKLDVTVELAISAGVTTDISVLLEAENSGYFSEIRDFFALYETPMEVYLKNLSSHDSTYESVFYEMLEACIGNQNFLKELIGFPEDYPFLDYCQTVKEQDENLPINRERLWGDVRYLDLYKNLWGGKYETVLLSIPVNLADIAREYKTTSQYTRAKQLMSIDRSDSKREILEYCHKTLGKNLEISGSALKNRRLLENIDVLKSSVKEMVQLKDPVNNAKFIGELDNLKFLVPHYRKVQFELMKDVLKKEIQLYKTGDLLQELPEYFGYNFFMRIATGDSSEYDNEGKLINEFEEVEVVCDLFELSALSDHVYSATGAAYLSWITAFYPDYGLGVVAHELGHFVSRKLIEIGNLNSWEIEGKADKAYYRYLPDNIPHWEHRRCVSQFHPKEENATENQYTEEDWADYFAAKIINHVKSKMPYLKNFGCLLMREDDQRYVIEPENDLDSSHSSSIFRLIHVQRELDGEELPHSCKAYEESRMQCEAHPK